MKLAKSLRMEKRFQEARRENLVFTGSKPDAKDEDLARDIAGAVGVDMTGIGLRQNR